MDLAVEQACPQCGAPVTISESGRLLNCPFCGVKNFLQSRGLPRFLLPDKIERALPREEMLYTPYIRFKGTVFIVGEKGISHRIIDTTQQGNLLSGLPPTLGLRPQAMKLKRLTPECGGHFLEQTIKASAILAKAAQVSELSSRSGHTLFHRAFIGESLSFIYLPLYQHYETIFDGVTDSKLFRVNEGQSLLSGVREFNPLWKPFFQSTLCPQCGAHLDGEGDCLVLTCRNCDTAWQVTASGLKQVEWFIAAANSKADFFLPFWKVSCEIPVLGIHSFADFIDRTNQPLVIRPEWHEHKMSFWIPAFKLRPKIFLQAAKRVTVNQRNFILSQGHVQQHFQPVTLPMSEARQSIKVVLAASALNRKKIYPHLPQVQLKSPAASLIYLPFTDKGHDVVLQQATVAISKSVLKFGRMM